MSQDYVYTYFDEDRDEPIYVGRGVGGRYARHLIRKDKHPLTQRLASMAKRGQEPLIKIEQIDTPEEADMLEMFLIAAYGRKDLGFGSLLNLSDGGEGNSGYRFTDAQKEIQRINAQTSWLNLEIRARRIAGLKKAHNTPELLDLKKANAADPIIKEKQRINQTAAWTPEKRATQSRTLSQPCTIDGTIIYSSRREFVKALGKGYNGLRHSNFRYLNER